MHQPTLDAINILRNIVFALVIHDILIPIMIINTVHTQSIASYYNPYGANGYLPPQTPVISANYLVVPDSFNANEATTTTTTPKRRFSTEILLPGRHLINKSPLTTTGQLLNVPSTTINNNNSTKTQHQPGTPPSHATSPYESDHYDYRGQNIAHKQLIDSEKLPIWVKPAALQVLVDILSINKRSSPFGQWNANGPIERYLFGGEHLSKPAYTSQLINATTGENISPWPHQITTGLDNGHTPPAIIQSAILLFGQTRTANYRLNWQQHPHFEEGISRINSSSKDTIKDTNTTTLLNSNTSNNNSKKHDDTSGSGVVNIGEKAPKFISGTYLDQDDQIAKSTNQETPPISITNNNNPSGKPVSMGARLKSWWVARKKAWSNKFKLTGKSRQCNFL